MLNLSFSETSIRNQKICSSSVKHHEDLIICDKRLVSTMLTPVSEVGLEHVQMDDMAKKMEKLQLRTDF